MHAECIEDAAKLSTDYCHLGRQRNEREKKVLFLQKAQWKWFVTLNMQLELLLAK